MAGPVTVGVALVSADFNWETLPGVTDSKKLTAKKREEIYESARRFKKEGVLHYAVASVTAKDIDTYGIVPSIKKAMERALRSLEKNSGCDPKEVLVRLDGGLVAPTRFVHQETIIKGDMKEKSIGLASIVAKVTRDRYMCLLSEHEGYVHYAFASHKGYGSKKHCEAIRQFGLSDMHRKSFCRKLIGL